MSNEEKTHQKINTIRTLEYHFNGEPYYKLVRKVQEFDTFERKWNYRKDLETIQELTPSEIGLFREKEILVAFPRTATNEKTLLSMFAYFTQRLDVRVDSGKRFKHDWLSLSDGKLFVQHNGFNGKYSGMCEQADLSGKQECLTISRIGKPKRISAERLDAMLRAKEISMVFANEKLGEIRLEPKSE